MPQKIVSENVQTVINKLMEMNPDEVFHCQLIMAGYLLQVMNAKKMEFTFEGTHASVSVDGKVLGKLIAPEKMKEEDGAGHA